MAKPMSRKEYRAMLSTITKKAPKVRTSEVRREVRKMAKPITKEQFLLRGAQRMSLRAFAGAMGVTDRAVRKAIRSGKIPADVVGSRKAGSRTFPFISDPAKAAELWVSNSGPMHNPTKTVDYASLPDGLKKARMLRDLRQAKWHEERAKDASRAKAGRNAININELKLVLHAVGEGVIESAGAGSDSIRKVTRTVVGVLKNKLIRKIEEKISGK